ncbi:6121_t:CDS:2 [Scutellospora calospora]|uniref:6121_t:CDS:1 n=1 Tax=Scutellospora calospora TaxID=85575 RepID=A0ACA9JV30_9GLOM|nr:6121_t:CDS:2 [Scutellospora calospora]
MSCLTESQTLPDYYQILEISPSAPEQEVRKAYRKLALKYHPDKNIKQRVITSNTTVNEHFISINEAYNILGNAETRANYDVHRLTGTSPLNHPPSTLDKMHKRFREIMKGKEIISELSKLFMDRSVELGWVAVNTEKQLFSAYEREISLIESSILSEPEESSFIDSDDQYDHDLSVNYLPEDDIIQIVENPQWIVIDKETLIRSNLFSDFVESQDLLIKSISDVVSPLMMACSYGTWMNDSKVAVLDRIKLLQRRITKYLEVMNQKINADDQALDFIIDKIKTGKIQEQIANLSKHPIMDKMDGGKFGQNVHPLLNLAALIGPTFAGCAVTVHFNEGDLESFIKFIDLFDRVVALFVNEFQIDITR